jgi:hypothetical protein
MSAEQMHRGNRAWQYVLFALFATAFAITICSFVDWMGVGGPPWYGWWDANAQMSGERYTIAIAQPRPDGAAARAGLRDGDLIDLRAQTLAARLAVAYQPMATQTTPLIVRRGNATLHVAFKGSTLYQVNPAWKINILMNPLSSLFFASCILLIMLRRWWSRDARVLAIVLFCMTLMLLLDPSAIVVPSATANIALFLIARAGAAGAPVLIVWLASGFGMPSKTRTVVTYAAYAAIVAGFCTDLAAAVGFVTLWIDPVPFIFRIGPLRGILDMLDGALPAICAILAVIRTPVEHRPKAAWMVLPLPVALFAHSSLLIFATFIKSWFANITIVYGCDLIILVSAFIVTYALLKRRVLDFEFVLSRTLVATSVSLIVVASFVLLEWMLGTALAGVSHATGFIANGALALVLGLSLNAIHKRVDMLMDSVLFRKRHEDERALLNFSKEAAFVTGAAALIDQAVAKLRAHTDARNAAILLESDGVYTAAGSFGEAVFQVSENDGVILALKMWHKPLDPHRYDSDMRGALAVPMVSRARVLGVVLLGERAGGEAYAPDEIEALAQFAHGVGSSLDALSTRNDGILIGLQQSMASMAEAIARLSRETDGLRNDIRAGAGAQ